MRLLPLILACTLPLAHLCPATDLELPSGRILKNYQVIGEDPQWLMIMHSDGVDNFDFFDLPKSIRDKYDYSPKKAEEAKAKRIAAKEAKAARIQARKTAEAKKSPQNDQNIKAANKKITEETQKRTVLDIGQWEISSYVSKIDDSTSVHCSLDSITEVEIGYENRHPSLTFVVREESITAMIYYGGYVGYEKTNVTFRFDKQKAYSELADVADTHNSIFLRSNIPIFIHKLEKCRTLLVRVTPNGELPITVEFNPRGITAALKKSRETFASPE